MGRNRVRQLGTWSLLGSTGVVLAALAASPGPVTTGSDRVNGAMALYGAGDRAGASHVSRELLLAEPRDPDSWLLAGMLAEDRRAMDDADRAYTAALGLLAPDDPRASEIRVSLADVLRRKGDPEGALAALEKEARAR